MILLKKEFLISVIVTTYNRCNLILDTINSILNQTINNIELIIVDDGSLDRTEEIVNSIKDDRIKYIRIDNWGGPAKPRNVGIDNSTGNYIAFCDDDDQWYPDKLSKQLDILNTYQVIGVGSNIDYIGNRKFQQRIHHVSNKVEFYTFNEILAYSKSVPLSSLIVRRNDVRFAENRDYIYVEDWDYQLKLTCQGANIAFLNEPLIKYRLPELTNRYPLKSVNIINVINTYKSSFINEFQYNYSVRNYYNIMALQYLKINDLKNAKHCYTLSFSYEHNLKSFFGKILCTIPSIIRNNLLDIYYYFK